MKTKEELNAFKENVETENRQRRALTDEETEQVSGGAASDVQKKIGKPEPVAIAIKPAE